MARSLTEAVVRHVAEEAGRRGFDTHELLALAGIEAASRPDASVHVSAAAYLALWDRILAGTRDAAVALEIGQAWKIERIEAMGFLALTSETLGDAFQRFARFRALYNRGARWDLEPESVERHRFTWTPWAEPKATPRARRAADEAAAAELVSSGEQLVGRRVRVLAVSFPYPAPADDAPYRACFGVRPRFDAEQTALWIAPSELMAPCRLAYAAMRAWFEQICARTLASAQASLASEIEAWVLRDLANGEPTMARLARGLATTPRTLHRRLAKSGTSFSEILDRVRRDLATSYLSRGGLSVSEVAGLLGFADSGAFVRAFRRWFAMTPGQWRARSAPVTETEGASSS